MIFLLAVRNFMKKKRRSFVCLLAVLLSVGVMTCVGQVVESMKLSNIKTMEEMVGSNHISVWVEDGNIDKVIQLLPYDCTYGISRGGVGSAELKEISLDCYSTGDRKYFEMLGYKITDGKFPDQNNEVCIDERTMERLGFQIGDEVDFPIQIASGNGDTTIVNKKLVISGAVYLNPLVHDKSISVLLITNETAVKIFGESTDISIKLQDTNDIRPLEDRLIKLLGGDAVSLNTDLLRVIDAVEENISLIVIYVLIFATSVICLFNIFQISLLERMQQLGMLRCMGLTNKELFQILMVEGLLMGILGIPAGVLLGLAVSRAACSMVFAIQPYFYDIVAFDVQNIFIVIGIGSLTILFCVLKSVIKIRKLSPIDAMRMVGITQSRRKKRRFSLICEKTLGIKGRLAYENLWIYQNRARITIFSISVSLAVLFLISFFYSNYMEQYANMYIDKYAYSVEMPNTIETGIPQTILEEISDIEGVRQVYGFDAMSNQVFVEVDLTDIEVDPRFQDKFQQSQGKTEVMANLFGYNEASLEETKKLLIDGMADIVQMKENPVVIISQKMYMSGDEKLSYQVGDKIDLKLQVQKETKEITVIVGGIIDKTTFLNRDNFFEGPEIIMSLDYMQKIFNKTGYTDLRIALESGNENLEIEKKIKSICLEMNEVDYEVVSHAETVRKQIELAQNLIRIVGMLVGIIAFISFMNIMNTISTSILLRSREFAMMRAIGFSKLDIVQIIISEGLFYGGISAVLGSILGLLASYLLGTKMNIAFTIQSIPWLWDIGWTLLCFVLCVFVTLSPLHRILKSNIKEGMSED